MKNGMKEFEWRNGKPFAYSYQVNDYVLFKGIHFQGNAKYMMIKYYFGSNLKLLSSLWIKLHVEYPLKKMKGRIKQFYLSIYK